MTLDEYIQKLEAAQKVLPDMISVAAKNATIRAVEAAQEKTPPTADSLSGINTRTGELKQHWATDSKIIPEQQAGQYVTELNNNKEYMPTLPPHPAAQESLHRCGCLKSKRRTRNELGNAGLYRCRH